MYGRREDYADFGDRSSSLGRRGRGLDPGGGRDEPTKRSRQPTQEEQGRYRVRTNHFLIRLAENFLVHKYEIEFPAEFDQSRVHRRAMIEAIPQFAAVGVYAQDSKRLWTTVHLGENTTYKLKGNGNGNGNGNGHGNGHGNGNGNGDVTLRAVFQKSFYLQDNDDEARRLRNIIFREAQRGLEMPRMGRMFVDNRRQMKFPELRIEVVPGFYTCVHDTEDQPYRLNIDICTRILQLGTVLERWEKIRSMAASEAEARKEFECTMEDKVLITRYNTENAYRVHAIEWGMSPLSEFEVRSGAMVSYKEYLLDKYGRDARVTRTTAPMIAVQRRRPKRFASPPRIIPDPSAPSTSAAAAGVGGTLPAPSVTTSSVSEPEYDIVHLVPEFCILTGIPEDVRDRALKHLEPYTKPKDSVRVDLLRGLIDKLNSTNVLREWRITVDRDMMRVDAKQMITRSVNFETTTVPITNGNWSARDQKPVDRPTLRRALLVCENRNRHQADDLVRMLMQVFQQFDVRGYAPEVVTAATRDSFKVRLNEKYDRDLQLVLVLLPTNSPDFYKNIKRFCLTEFSKTVVSQCVLAETMSDRRGLMSKITKIAMQVVCKLGGALWGPETIHMPRTMTIGIASSKEVTVWVSSRSDACTHYRTEALKRDDRRHIGSVFDRMLRKYIKDNPDVRPEHIVIMKSNVPEGEFTQVVQREVPIYHYVCAKIAPNYHPVICILAIAKMNHTRLFRVEQQPPDRETPSSANVLPGTVVDTVVVDKPNQEFYMVPHQCNIGLSRTTKYNVLYMSEPMDLGLIEKHVRMLCDLYYNWTGTIRVPAPVKYAEKCAELLGSVLGGAAAREQFYHPDRQGKITDALYML